MDPTITVQVLPPDPEGMNDRRAAWAEHTLNEFMLQTGADPENSISDLLADIMHLCDREPELYGEFERQLERARGHYTSETTDEE
jgi:hypothetical protein